MSMLEDFMGLIFPDLCVVCNDQLMNNERILCSECEYRLPRTNYHLDKNNPVSQMFWGRVQIKQATAYFKYNKGSRFSKLLYELKYNGRKDIGTELGKMFGAELSNSEYRTGDLILAVPLHKKKRRQRGYNQAELIAEGIAESMNIPIENEAIERIVNSSSQTTRSRYQRWENVDGVFNLVDTELVKGKHVLLVDDVVTTGATLEACAASLIRHDVREISLVALAMA